MGGVKVCKGSLEPPPIFIPPYHKAENGVYIFKVLIDKKKKKTKTPYDYRHKKSLQNISKLNLIIYKIATDLPQLMTGSQLEIS